MASTFLVMPDAVLRSVGELPGKWPNYGHCDPSAVLAIEAATVKRDLFLTESWK